jgi:GTP-binding protein
MKGLSFRFEDSMKRFGPKPDISGPMEDLNRTEEHRRRVSGWTPVVKVISDQRLRVAIVGRMNSGKSSLFNLLARDYLVPGRGNIVKDFAGITRDSVESYAELGSMGFTIIDTPGIVGGKIVEEALRTLATADMAIFVAAVDEDISDDERNLVRYLHVKKLPTFLIVNKMDLVPSEDQDKVLTEYNSLGLGNAVPFSARQKDGLEMLEACLRPFYNIHCMRKVENDWDIEDLAMEGDERAMEEVRERNLMDQYITIAIVGRTNSGKSSLINRLVGYERNRAADEVNTTRDPIEIPCIYRGRKVRIVDTAGAIRARFYRSREFMERLHQLTLKEIRFAHIVIVVFDATEGHPNKYDMALLHRISAEGRPFVLCANKWDAVLDPSATAEAIDFKIKRQVQEVKYASAVVVSAHSGLNLTLLLDHAMDLYEKWNKRVRGHELTKFWRRMEKAIIIPHHVSRIGRIRQVNTRPPTFLLQLQTKDDDNLLPKSLQEMIKNAIVEEFDFKGVPIRLIQQVKDMHPDYV